MRYLAILKDSLREALDSKLLYVTFGLSGLLILLLASVSFRPVPLKEQLEGVCWLYDLVFAHGTATAEVVEAHQLNDADEPWKADYRFTLALRLPGGASDKKEARRKTDQLESWTRVVLWWLKDVTVREVPAPKENEARLEFTSRGTKLPDSRSWPHEPTLFFGALPAGPFARGSLNYWVYWIENRLVNTIGGWVAVLLGVIVTASFIPNMLRKGTVDLLVSKPLHRTTLLVFKYIGGLTFVFLNAAVAIGGVWLVLGLRTGVWAPGFLLSTFIITFFFAILYAVSTLFAVLTRSTIVSILMTCLAWLIIWLVGWGYNTIHAPPSQAEARMRQIQQTGRPAPAGETPGSGSSSTGWLTSTVDVLHAVLPRSDDLGALTTHFLSSELLPEQERQQMEFKQELPFSWAESVGVCLAYIVLLLGLACWRFSRKDY
jgi:hypothetical protein